MLCHLSLNKRYPCLSAQEIKALSESIGCDIIEDGETYVLSCRSCEELGRVALARPLEVKRMARATLPARGTITMDSLIARALVNIARVGPLKRVLEPFVGTGAIAHEAERLGAYVVGLDIDLRSLRLATKNTSADLIQADARLLPLRRAFDAAVGDAPYGRMSIAEVEIKKLLYTVLEQLSELVRGYVVVALPIYFDVPYVPSCLMYVHGGLYRAIAIVPQSGGGPS